MKKRVLLLSQEIQDVTQALEKELHQARKAGCIIAGICGCTIALARARTLDDVRHNSNGSGYLDEHVPRYSDAEKYVHQSRAVRGDDIITAPAPAPASFAAEVLAAAGLDPEKAHELKSMLGAEHAS